MSFEWVEIYNYDGRKEIVRVDLIESVRLPSGRVNDNGAVVLVGGRQIAFGHSTEAESLVKKLRGKQ